VNEGLVDL